MYRLLIVENQCSPTTRDVISDYMFHWNIAAKILTVHRYSDAISALASGVRFDVLMTDIPLDSGDGFSLLEQAVTYQPWIRRVIVTGPANFQYAVKAVNMKLDGYLLKPIDESSFKAVITNIWPDSFRYETIESEISLDADGKTEMVHYLKQVISEEYASDISLTYLAEKVHFSPCYLSTVFSKITGMCLLTYIKKIRLDKAVELLQSTDLKVSDIATQVGFKTSAYFCTTFKKLRGKSPAQYREDIQKAS